MKQSTSFAQVATNLLNVLQGYTKGIRFLLVMFLTLTVSANAWGQTTATLTLSSSKKFGTTSGSTLTDDKNNTWTCTGSTIQNTYNNTYKGQQFGTSKNAGNYTFTCTIAGATISSVKITAAAGSTSAKYSISVGGSSKYSGNLSKTSTTYGGTNASGSGEISISLQGSGTGAAVYLGSITVIYTTASATKHTVTFDAGTNGTCSTPSLTEASAGAGVTLPNVTPNSGYRFLGWATTSAATTANAGKAGENYKPSSNITLYAIYVQQYTIQWYADGTLLEAKTYDKGSPIQAPTVSVTPCEGMQHVGWTTISDYTHATEAPSSFFDEDTPLGNATFNMKFYALFAKVEGPTETPTTLTETIKSTNFSDGTSTRTYESTSANWTWKKNDGSNIANYDEIRLYANHSMTIAPKTECSISKIVATCTSDAYATALGGSSLTGATKTVSSSTVTITPTGGDIIITQTAQSRVSQFVVTFTASVSSGQKYSDYTTQCTTKTAPSLSASVSSLAFGNVTVNQSSPKTFNLSGFDLTANAKLAISGTDEGMFSVTPTSVTPSNGSFTDQTITVTYTPTAKASHSATLTISSEDAEDVTISLAGTGIAQTANYTIKHYQQNLDGTYPSTPTHAETKSGEVGTQVTPAVKSYTGFKAPSTQTVTIKSDGSTVVTYQYTRNSYTLTWDVNEGNALTGSYTSGSVKYGAAITKPADPTREGHVFKGWHNGTSVVTPATTMPASNLTYTAQWTPTYTITWLANGQEFHKQENAVEGTALDLPDSEPDAATYACDDKVFVGWTKTQISGSTDNEPADLFTTKTAKVEDAATTYYAVFATKEDEGSSAELVKMTADDDFNIGDKLVIIAEGTQYGLYQKTSTSNYVDFWTTKNNDGVPTLAEIEEDSKKYLEVSAGTATGSIKLGDATNGYLYNSSSTDMSISTSNSSDWSIIAWTDDTFTFKAGQYLSCRTDLTSANKNKWRGAGANCNCETGSSCSGIIYYNVYKYTSGSITSYSDYTTSCVALPDPVISFVTTPADPIVFDPVNCGSTTSKAQAKTVQVSGANLQEYVSVEVTGPYKIARTSSTNLSDYTTSLTLDKTNTGNINANYSTIYIISCPPAQSTDATTGTLTFTTKKGNTLTVNLSTPTVNCTTYALTFNDRGNKTVENYYAGVEVPQPADPTGVCTEPIHYVFDGWAEATVANGSTEYTKVTFPYTMPGQNKTLYAVYRYLTSGGNGDYNLVTSALDDWSGDYLIAYDNETFADGTVGGEDGIGKLRNKVDLSSYISNNTIPATEGDKYHVTLEAVTGGYVLKTQDGKYNYHTNNTGNGISASTISFAQKYPINVNFVSQEEINLCLTGDAAGSVLRYNTTGYFRFYKNGGLQPVYLYKKSSGTTLYTSAPVCGPLVEITSDKDIYVTGGNAGGTRSLVVAQKKITFSATRLQPNAGGNAPSIKVPAADITISGTPTTKVALSITQNLEEQGDGTYAGTGEITITYTPTEYNVNEDINVQLRAEYNTGSDAILDAFTVHARSLPSEFVIVAKSGDKWYALNGDMSNGSSANPANGQITLNDDANPTQATYAPCNTIYTFDGLPNTGDRTRVRFQGTEGAWLWAASGTNTGIQNKSLKTTPSGNMEETKAYNWKLETEDNITYKFHNDNNNRLLGLSGEKFGMYSSAVNDIRILPYDAKCLYNYAPSNLKVSVLKGTYVTLTWDAVAGATKYQYSTDATNWTDCGTEPTVTINGLKGAYEYTYYIRAYHEDAGVTNECIDYAEITFTTADCDDVPTDITYTADLNSITVSWTAVASTATVKLYSDETGTTTVQTLTDATSPCKFTDLTKNTTYYVQVFSGGDCASQIVKVKTEDIKVDVVEWQPQGIVVDINTNERVGVTLENEVSYGSGAGAEATELFFSKYYEATTNVKLVAIYNGTKNIIDLNDYEIHYGKDSWENQYITLKDFGVTKGQIQPGEEIILYTMSDNDDSDKKIMACVNGDYPDGKWVRVTQSNNEGKGHLSFAGNKTLVLKKAGTVIDVIGALDSTGKPTSKNANSKPSWGDANGWNCATGFSIADDTEIGISTNRCLLIRNNTVTSGANAVTSNIDNFVTLCSEWKGAQVPDSDVDNGVAASCENFAYVGTFDYSDYYTQYESMGDKVVFEENVRNADGTVNVHITDLYKQSCRNIRITLEDKDGNVLSNREYKVPIMITTTQGTDGDAFIALQENLAMIETDGEGNVVATHPLSLEEVREICKTCDVVIRDNAILQKMADDAENDHPQVRDIYVYENSSLVVPNGTNYTINNLSIRRKEDAVASVSAYPNALKLPESAAAPISLDFRLSAESWHWFTLPYECNISEVTWVDGSPAQYNVDWFLMTYDGEKRAATQAGGCWKAYTGTTIKAGEGFILAINGNLNNPAHTYELRFPMSKDVLVAEGTDKTVDVRAWGVETNIRPNHKGWNLVGNPYLAYYQRNNITNFEGLRLGQLVGPDPQTGYWEQTGEVPYVVVPVGAGWVAYEQVLASETDLLPFTAYFVQVGNDGEHDSSDELSISFDHTKLQLSATPMPASIIQRSATEVSEPIIVGVSLTNAKGESDKTSLIIDNQYTNEYEMHADFFKWFGDYYKYYTKPVLYTVGADQGKRAFNAISEDLATQPISLGMYAAQAGNYTFSLDLRSDLSKVQEVWLYDATQDTYTNLLQDSYTFNTAKTESAGRFFLSVKMAPKVSTNIDNIADGTIWATTQDHTIIVNGLLSNAQLWIYDATGQLLHSDQTQYFQHSYSVPISGTYFVRVQNTMQTQTIKVVVE